MGQQQMHVLYAEGPMLPFLTLQHTITGLDSLATPHQNHTSKV